MEDIMEITTAYLWEQGECRNNEDSLVLLQAQTRRGTVLAAAVCDGIGGLSEGETASGYAAEMIAVWFHKELLPMAEKRKGHKSLYRSAVKLFYETDEGLKEYGRKKKFRLGTTVTLFFMLHNWFYVLHIGDCRIYKIREQAVMLTKDDGEGHYLHKCIGAGKWEKPQWKYGKIKRGTGFLICSDGFYRKLKEEELAVCAAPFCGQEGILFRRLEAAGEQIRNRKMEDNASAVSIVVQ